jgi:hypothetical protein
MKILHAQSHRRSSPRRPPISRKETRAARSVQAIGPRGEVRAACSRPAVARPATGLLIPRIARSVPRIYEGRVAGLAGMIAELVDMGALSLKTSGESPGDLLTKGITAITHRGLLRFEDQWGEYVQVQVGSEGIYCDVWQECHSWRMRLKPIVTALPTADAIAFIKALNSSQVQGPFFWDEIVGFAAAALEPGDDSEGVDSERKAPAEDARDAARWLDKLFENHPALHGAKRTPKDATLVQILMPAIVSHGRPKSPPPELAELVRCFIEKSGAASRYTDERAIMVTTWDRNCHINHAHDYIHHGIHNEGWDNQDGSAFHIEAGSMSELRDGMEIVGQFVEAAQNLEEWSNRNC